MRRKGLTIAVIADAPAGGTGADAGGWADATQRDAALVDIAALLARVNDVKGDVNDYIRQLRAAGMLPNETTLVTTADITETLVAGGTGATAGGYDTAVNRNLLVVRCNAAIDLIDEMQALMNRMEVAAQQGGITGALIVRRSLLNRATLSDITNVAAGGDGAQAGCYDSAANRNTMITRVNAGINLVEELGNKLRYIESVLIRNGVMQP